MWNPTLRAIFLQSNLARRGSRSLKRHWKTIMQTLQATKSHTFQKIKETVTYGLLWTFQTLLPSARTLTRKNQRNLFFTIYIAAPEQIQSDSDLHFHPTCNGCPRCRIPSWASISSPLSAKIRQAREMI